MDFKEIFDEFYHKRKELKTLHVASCDLKYKPNAASKMLISIVKPNLIYFLDYKFTHTYANVGVNPQLSVSFMDDANFTGYRLTGTGEILAAGKEFNEIEAKWERRLTHYEADRIVRRMTGQYSTREAENCLPKDFHIIKFTALEASAIKPDRVLRAQFYLPRGADQ